MEGAEEEPLDHSGLRAVGKERRVGRGSDCRAVTRSVLPDQWGVLEPKLPLQESQILLDGAALVTHCAQLLAGSSPQESGPQQEHGGASNRTAAGGIINYAPCSRR